MINYPVMKISVNHPVGHCRNEGVRRPAGPGSSRGPPGSESSPWAIDERGSEVAVHRTVAQEKYTVCLATDGRVAVELPMAEEWLAGSRSPFYRQDRPNGGTAGNGTFG